MSPMSRLGEWKRPDCCAHTGTAPHATNDPPAWQMIIQGERESAVDKKKAASKGAATTENESKTNEAAVRSESDRLDDPLFVPHLDELEISEAAAEGADEYALIIESICGVTDDSQAVEQYDGTLGVTTAFVAAHQSPACQVQWNSNWRRSTPIPAPSTACAGAAAR